MIAGANRHDSPLLRPTLDHLARLNQGLGIGAFITFANAVIITRRILATGWYTHRWDTRPARRP